MRYPLPWFPLVEADLVQVAAAVIQIVDLSAVGQGGGGTVAVEVVVVADAFGNGQVQHVVLCIAPVGFGQTVLCVLFLSRHFHWCWPMIWPLPL